MVTPGLWDATFILQLRTACAARVEPVLELGEKVTIYDVLQSTPVIGVLYIVPVMFEGFVRLLAGCS